MRNAHVCRYHNLYSRRLKIVRLGALPVVSSLLYPPAFPHSLSLCLCTLLHPSLVPLNTGARNPVADICVCVDVYVWAATCRLALEISGVGLVSHSPSPKVASTLLAPVPLSSIADRVVAANQIFF